MNYERINFKNGQLVSPGSVDLETGELTMPVYTGETPINDVNLNKMDEAIEYLFENGVGGGSLPSGAIVEYEGTEVPVGYEEVDNNYLESGVIYSTQMSTYLMGSNTFRFYNLTFRKTYTKPPVVIVSYFNNSPTNYGDIPVSSGNVTTTGCRINFSNEGTYSNLGVSYVVIPVE